MNADDGLAEIADRIEAGVAESQGQLIFAAGAETPVAFVAGGKIRALLLLARMNITMNFQIGHENSPAGKRASRMPEHLALSD